MHDRRRRWLLALSAAVTATAAWGQPTAPTAEVVVHAGRVLVDASTGDVRERQSILVQDGRIAGVQPGYIAPPGARVIDLGDRFVLPGLIDAHVHLLSAAGASSMHRAGRTSAQMAFHGARNAGLTLRAGFTTVADLGGDSEAIFALRDAITRGDAIGPRILASGYVVTPDGGDSDVHGVSDEYADVFRAPTVCSGVEGCRRAVRQQVNRGADLIKITATGGVLAQTDTGLNQQFMDDELKAIVEAAHSLGRPVVAHAHGTAGVNAALRAGVNSIEHGTFLDAESIQLFRRGKAWLVPTLLAGDTIVKAAADPTWRTAAVRAKALEVGPKMIDAARRARDGGVRVAFGTDSGVSPHGENAREFVLMVQAGFTPMEAIAAATTGAAAHLGIDQQVGRLRPGLQADLIGVGGNPLEDVSRLQDVSFVMKGGMIYRDDRSP